MIQNRFEARPEEAYREDDGLWPREFMLGELEAIVRTPLISA
jgi:hypothetical protein